ncbi:hypothetical protein L1887_61348 [Cichorium endivia]|nr:hypothetical protein L1887_61348 [Cichorium endivia]
MGETPLHRPETASPPAVGNPHPKKLAAWRVRRSCWNSAAGLLRTMAGISPESGGWAWFLTPHEIRDGAQVRRCSCSFDRSSCTASVFVSPSRQLFLRMLRPLAGDRKRPEDYSSVSEHLATPKLCLTQRLPASLFRRACNTMQSVLHRRPAMAANSNAIASADCFPASHQPLRLTSHAHNDDPQHQRACCAPSLPSSRTSNSPKGETLKLGGLDTYVAGPKDAKKAIVVVYDIFGLWPTTKQGVDVLAEATKARVSPARLLPRQALPAGSTTRPTQTEKKQALQDFFGGRWRLPGPQARPGRRCCRPPEGRCLEARGLMGFCWGGKFSVLNGGAGTKFSSVAQVHPAMVDPRTPRASPCPWPTSPPRTRTSRPVEAFRAGGPEEGLCQPVRLQALPRLPPRLGSCQG